jgi:predicted metal-binding protein
MWVARVPSLNSQLRSIQKQTENGYLNTAEARRAVMQLQQKMEIRQIVSSIHIQCFETCIPDAPSNRAVSSDSKTSRCFENCTARFIEASNLIASQQFYSSTPFGCRCHQSTCHLPTSCLSLILVVSASPFVVLPRRWRNGRQRLAHTCRQVSDALCRN